MTLMTPVLLLAAGLAATPPPAPPLPDPLTQRELRRTLRRDASRWLRTRQDVLVPCHHCAGRGLWPVRRYVHAGRVVPRKAHPPCHGLGQLLRPHQVERLYGFYLEHARKRPGLSGQRHSLARLREYLGDTSVDRAERWKEVTRALGHLDAGAQVRRVSIESGPAGSWFGTVVTTADPRSTRWVRVRHRWVLLGKEDEALLRQRLEAAARQRPSTKSPPRAP